MTCATWSVLCVMYIHDVCCVLLFVYVMSRAVCCDRCMPRVVSGVVSGDVCFMCAVLCLICRIAFVVSHLVCFDVSVVCCMTHVVHCMMWRASCVCDVLCSA